jgi:hypothetical protein
VKILPQMTTYNTRAAKQSAVRKTASQMIEYLQKTHASNLHLDYVNHIHSYDSFLLSTINITTLNSDSIDIDIDLDKVKAYSLLDESTVPPVVVADGHILDGYHRVTVAKTQGKKYMSAYIGVTA